VDVGVDAAHSSLDVITAVVLATASSSLHLLSLCRSMPALVACVVVVCHPHDNIAIADVATTSSSLPHYDVNPHKEHCGVHHDCSTSAGTKVGVDTNGCVIPCKARHVILLGSLIWGAALEDYHRSPVRIVTVVT
jgi:hypothetical protein